jgi:hypothetical protein
MTPKFFLHKKSCVSVSLSFFLHKKSCVSVSLSLSLSLSLTLSVSLTPHLVVVVLEFELRAPCLLGKCFIT